MRREKDIIYLISLRKDCPVRARMEIDYLSNHRDAIPGIADWFHNEWSCRCPDRTRDDFEEIIRTRAISHGIPFALVAVNSSGVIGTVSLKIHDMVVRTGLGPWLAGLYVDAQWRGRGVGRRLVEAMEKTAAEMGFGEVFLYTSGAEQFYFRLGWRIMGQREYCGCPYTLMGRNIAARSRITDKAEITGRREEVTVCK